MKHILSIIAAAALMAACSKELQHAAPAAGMDSDGNPAIEFLAAGDGLDAEVRTRAAAVTSLSSFGVIAEKTATSEQAWAVTSVTQSGADYKTGKYWPSTDQKFAFYASNATMSYAATGVTVSPSTAATDVVVAYFPYAASSYRTKNKLSFNHIFARIGAITLNAPSGYTMTNTSVALSAPVGGTYNIKTSQWTSTGTAAAQSIVVGANDVYVVPGNYTLTVKYTLTKGEYTESFTKTAIVTLAQGKINTISANIPTGTATELQFIVEISEWGSNSITVTF